MRTINKMIRTFIIALLFVFSVSFFEAQSVNAQRRDYFTDEEVELIRDSNEIDRRIDVLIKAIDRRLLVINKDTSQSKQLSKDEGKWGALPTGTRLELLFDISKIFEKAIDDIDDLAERKDMNSEMMKGNVGNETDEITKGIIKKNDEKFPSAVHNLADASRRMLPGFEAMIEETKDEKEIGALLRAVESCNLIIEAATQIARPAEKKRKN